MDVIAGQKWQDQDGWARVMAVVEGYAMLRRRRGNPFLMPVTLLENGRFGWVLLCRICGKADCDDDCEELAAIYREQQREKLRDLMLDEEDDRSSTF